MTRRSILNALLAALVVAGCSSGDSDPDASAETSLGTSTTIHDQAEVEVPGPGESWDLLYIQDSVGFGIAELYAQHIEQSEGVDVVVHDKTVGDLPAVKALASLRGEGADDWRELVTEAEVIVFFGNPMGSGATEDFGPRCMIAPSQGVAPVHYSEADWQPYRDILDEVYATIWNLRDGQPVVLRAVGFLDPAPHQAEDAGIGDECRAALEALNDTLEAAAVAGGATFVATHDLFNGPDHDQHPRDRGWIGIDGIHLSAEGQAAYAEGLAAAGFEINPAP